jgi:hypothetical protein
MTGVSKHIYLCDLLMKIFTDFSSHNPACDKFQLTLDGKKLACSCGYDEIVNKIKKLRSTM